MPAREVKAVADVLSDPENAELSAEEVAEKVIAAYEGVQASTHNLIVLGHFRLSETESYVAAVGPLSTRAVARARGVGERFAWDYKTRTGTGKYVLVPLVRDPNQAWDAARAAQIEVIKEWTGFSLSRDPFGPVCLCGLPEHPRFNSLGDAAQLACPLHPGGRDDGPA